MDLLKSQSADFPNGLQPDQFQTEVNASSQIVEQLLYIVTEGDNVTLHFEGPLTETEQTSLTTLCTNHVPVAPKQPPELFVQNGTIRWVDGASVPRTILGTQSTEIHISKESQGQFSSIKAAFAAVTASNVVFYVHPGQYVEDNPLIIRPGCTLQSKGTAVNTYIIAQNPLADIIQPGPLCTIQGFTLAGAVGPGARGVYFDGSQSGGTGQFTLVSQCFFRGCQVALESDGKDVAGVCDTLYLRELVITPLPPPSPAIPLAKAVYCHNGGSVISSSVMISGIPAPYNIPIGVGVYCSDANSKVAMAVTSTWYCGMGLYLDNDANSECALFTSRSNGTGVVIGPNGTTTRLSVASLDVKDSTLYDIDVQAQDCEFGLHNGFANPGKVRNPNNVKLNARFNASAYGKYYQASTGDIMIGTVSNPSKMAIGEGRYDQNNVSVFLNDNGEAGSWTDITNAISIFPSASVDIFPGTAANNCIYFGRDSGNVVGVKIEITTPCVSTIDRSYLVWEYWNGTEWSSFNIMQTQSEPPNEGVAGHIFNQTGKYHVRFGLTSNSPFATKLLNGATRYWSRIRILQTLPSIPKAQYLKFHTHATEFNKDGFLEFFGDSRSIQRLPCDSVITTSPAQTVYVSKTLPIKAASVDLGQSVSYFLQLPKEMDISFPLKCGLSFVCFDSEVVGNTTTSSSVTWNLRWALVRQTNGIFANTTDAPNSFSSGPNGTTTRVTTLAAGYLGQDIRDQISLDLSDFTPNLVSNQNDMLLLIVERDNNTTDFQKQLYLNAATFSYVSWCNGTHLLSF